MIERSKKITFQFEGEEFSGFEGETISAALLRAGLLNIRNAPSGEARGIFCGMGVCQECVVEVQGKKIESCRATLIDGLKVKGAEYA
jgi:D-hydroxyproline dehydrogenase subunit gamma